MRTKNPAYISGDHFVARVKLPDGKGGTVVKRFKQLVPRNITAPTERAKWARGVVKGLKAEADRDLTLEYLQRLQKKRTCCTLGDVFARLNDESELARKSLKDARKMVWALYRVVAIAEDLWVKHEGGIRGVKIGEEVPDRDRIHGLAATVLSADLVRRYFMRALGVEALEWRRVYENAASINSRLLQARCNFQGLTLRLKLRGLALPDLSGFMEGRLKTEDGMPEPVEAVEFGKVVELFDSLREGGSGCAAVPNGRWLWLCNLVIRQTGCRSLSTAMQIHRDWLQEIDGVHWLNVEGKTRYQIPVSEELAAEVLKSANFLFYPDAKDADEGTRKRNAARRGELLDEHTALLKGVIGAGSGGQVNHRLRDTVASALYHGTGDIKLAQEALGHADEKTTRKHYARRMAVSAVMQHELRAWLRAVAGAAWQKSNVIAMVPEKAA